MARDPVRGQVTDSMKKAIDETERRRNKQIAHNLARASRRAASSRRCAT